MGMRTNSWTESVRLGVRECQATRTSGSAGPSIWSRSAADRSPIEPMRDSEGRAYDGFEGEP